MKIENIKPGYPIYYVRSINLTLKNMIIHRIEKINICEKILYKITLHRENSNNINEFVMAEANDDICLTKNEYDSFIMNEESYYNIHKIELLKIKLKAFIYRLNH